MNGEARSADEDHEPRIAVTALKRPHEDVGRIPLHYVEAIRKAGGKPTVLCPFELHPEETIPEDLDVLTALDPDETSLAGYSALTLTGGGDVDPASYGQDAHPRTYNVSRRRDRFEMALLEQALDADMPVLAVCRGMQLMNVHLGGTLVQNLGDNPALLTHDRDRPRTESVHDVKIVEGSLLATCIGATTTGVNSHHHQALDDVAPSLEEIAWSGDGVLEAVAGRENAWVLGIQWHPEVMAPVVDDQARIFSCLVEAARLEHTAGVGERYCLSGVPSTSATSPARES